jgi:putative flippase GtrA
MSEALAAAEQRLEASLRSLGVGRYTSPSRALRAVEFGAVGVTGTVVNTLVFVLSPVAYFVAGALAFVGATVWTFALNWTVTYDRPRRSLVRAFGRYASVYAVGFFVYAFVLVAAVEVIRAPGILANVGAIAVAGLVNFTGSEVFALRSE